MGLLEMIASCSHSILATAFLKHHYSGGGGGGNFGEIFAVKKSGEILLPSATHLEERPTVSQSVRQAGRQAVSQASQVSAVN